MKVFSAVVVCAFLSIPVVFFILELWSDWPTREERERKRRLAKEEEMRREQAEEREAEMLRALNDELKRRNR